MAHKISSCLWLAVILLTASKDAAGFIPMIDTYRIRRLVVTHFSTGFLYAVCSQQTSNVDGDCGRNVDGDCGREFEPVLLRTEGSRWRTTPFWAEPSKFIGVMKSLSHFGLSLLPRNGAALFARSNPTQTEDRGDGIAM
ncbi:hypothetical protein AKJ16_DCAP01395 [Drosera capensis]